MAQRSTAKESWRGCSAQARSTSRGETRVAKQLYTKPLAMPVAVLGVNGEGVSCSDVDVEQ